MPVLRPDQFEQLQGILTDAFDKRGIAELVRTKLGTRLDKLVDPDQPTPDIVFDLLTWIDKRDMGTLEVLLEGAIGTKPEDGALRAFCEHVAPGALKPFDSQVFVKNLTSGLDASPRAEEQSHVFVCFSDRDRAQASEIVNQLEKQGITCWISYRNVPFGEDFQDAIVAAIEEARAMILVVSEAANNSEEIRKELALASKQRLFILPVRTENFEPTKGLRYQLATRQRIDLFEDRESNMRLMVETLRKRVSSAVR